MNERETEEIIEYRNLIKGLIDSINKSGTLKYLYTFIKLFVQKLG